MSKTTYSILGDSPPSVDEDTLRFGAFVEPFADRLIASVDNTPFTVGIYADWGQGKTTVMQMLRTHLEHRKCVTIWFDPWKYNSREAVWKGLALTLASQVREKQTLLREYRRKRAGMKSTLAEFLTSRLIGDRWAEKVVKAIETEPWSPTLLHEFEKDLAKLFALVAPDGDGKTAKLPVILFVDDLDRCLPEAALGVLEALKLVLNRRGLITVIGIAEEELTRAVAAAYAKELEALNVPYDQAWGAKYMQKIIQMPLPVPVVTDRSFDNYVLSCLQRSLVAEALGQPERWCAVIRDVCGRNLREVKRFINHFISEMDKAQANSAALGTEASFDPPRVGFTLSLAWPRFRRFYDHIRERVDDPDLLVRYQLFFSPQSALDIEALRDPNQTFHEDRDLRRLFNLCFSAPKGETPLVVPFVGWSDFAQYLQFGINPQPGSQTEKDERQPRSRDSGNIGPLIAEASSLASANRLVEAEGLLIQAEILARKTNDEATLCRVLIEIGSVHSLRGHRGAASESYEAALEIASRMNDRQAQLTALVSLARINRDSGVFSVAQGYFDKARVVAEGIGDPLTQVAIAHELADVAKDAKDWAGAVAQYQSALALAETAGHRPAQLSLLRSLGDLQRRSEPRRALETLTAAVDLARSLGDSAIEADTLLSLASVLADVGRSEDAAGVIKEAEPIVISLKQPGWWRGSQEYKIPYDARMSVWACHEKRE